METIFARKARFASVSCRLFTVYGERAREDHALIALIARATVDQRPFQIWGTGTQVRNWTYVGDIVRGMVLAAERINDASSINLGCEERITVRRAAELIREYCGRSGEIEFLPEMPVGPANRVASARLAKTVLGWEPLVSFEQGLYRTIEWYRNSVDLAVTADELSARLLKD